LAIQTGIKDRLHRLRCSFNRLHRIRCNSASVARYLR
uniref:IS5/IS1182 family transposase n=1 Tax=Haemonchus placei TaxID=6290 RepID=A0A0N4VVL5_HAEPC